MHSSGGWQGKLGAHLPEAFCDEGIAAGRVRALHTVMHVVVGHTPEHAYADQSACSPMHGIRPRRHPADISIHSSLVKFSCQIGLALFGTS